MLKNQSDFLRPFSPSTLLFSISNSTKSLTFKVPISTNKVNKFK